MNDHVFAGIVATMLGTLAGVFISSVRHSVPTRRGRVGSKFVKSENRRLAMNIIKRIFSRRKIKPQGEQQYFVGGCLPSGAALTTEQKLEIAVECLREYASIDFGRAVDVLEEIGYGK